MEHPLAPRELSGAVPLGRMWMGLVVDNHGGDSLVARFLAAIKPTAKVVPLPARFRIVDHRECAIPIRPDERCWISAETKDPHHVVVFLDFTP